MSASSEVVIETKNLTKRYADHPAVKGLNLVIRKGEIFGLLGPNGAGKTTTILMLLGLTEPSGGSAKVLDFDPLRNPLEVKQRVGYLPEDLGFYQDMTGRENLMYTARLNGFKDDEVKDRVDFLLERVGLADAGDKKVDFYSHGMKQRLGLADVLVKNPEIVILDEPTNGIDPKGAAEVLKMILELKQKEGMTVLISSHLLNQVQAICDRVGIFVRGEMVAEGPIETLGHSIVKGEPTVIEAEISPLWPEMVRDLGAIEGVIEVETKDNRLEIRTTADVRAQISNLAFQHGSAILHMRRRGIDLSDIYLRYFQEANVV